MIQIHRHKPVMLRNGKQVKLTEIEHQLLITLGMMDNRIVPYKILLEDVWGVSSVDIKRDSSVLWQAIARLNSKVKTIENRQSIGYILNGQVEFIG